MATAKQSGKKKTPKKAEGTPAKAEAGGAAQQSFKGKAIEAFDDDLVSPAVAIIRSKAESAPFTDNQIIEAVR
jgi:hypothetical protein